MLYRGLIVGLFGLVMVGCGSEPVELKSEPEAIDTKVEDTKSSVEEIQTVDDAVSGSDKVAAGKSKNWPFVVNNAFRAADKYAMDNNPSATFIGNKRSVNLVEQFGGQYEGNYLLTIVNDNSGDVSFAQLKPKFDINSSIDDLDDENELWEVVTAKYNGKEF